MESMTKAVLYARVSADRQRKQGTIESRVVELKRQIAAAGHMLVKEYIDDGYTGTVMDRPIRLRNKVPHQRPSASSAKSVFDRLCGDLTLSRPSPSIFAMTEMLATPALPS